MFRFWLSTGGLALRLWSTVSTVPTSGTAETLEGTRGEILSLIEDRPGTYPAAIAEEVDKNVQTVLYHMRRLDKEGAIATDRWRDRIHCFPTSTPQERRRPLASLRLDATREVMADILRQPFASLRGRAESIGISHEAVRSQLGTIREEGLAHPIESPDGESGWILDGGVGEVLASRISLVSGTEDGFTAQDRSQ